LQQNNTKPEDAAGSIDSFEKILCAIPSTQLPTLEPLKQQFIAVVQRFGLYAAMQKAVTIGLSNEPCRRDLDQIMASLGHDGSVTQQWY
jgi:hypothetical protein